MRRIIATVQTSIDGFMEGPGGEGDLGWMMPFLEDGLADNARLLGAVDTILLGRGTYHGFSRFWPEQEGDFADLMNQPRKLVIAHQGSLPGVEWGRYGNAELIDRDVEETLHGLKAADGGDMVVLASGGLVSSLLPHGLLDELQN